MYYRILGYVDSVDDASYPRKEKQKDGSVKEVKFEQWTYNLRIPGQTEFTKVNIAGDVKGVPAKDQRERWEDAEVLVVVEADRLTTIAGSGEEGKAWAFTSFHGVSIQEASSEEAKRLKDRRRAIKADLKAKRDAAKAERQATKKVA